MDEVRIEVRMVIRTRPIYSSFFLCWIGHGKYYIRWMNDPKGGVAKVTCPTFEAMGQIPAFHRTYFLFTLIFAVFVEKLYQIWVPYLIARRRCDQNNLIQYGRHRHVEFTSGLHSDNIFSTLVRQNVYAYQISCKSVNISRSYDASRSYDVSYIFKMASVRHLEFLKIQILDKFSRAESKSASAHQIWSKSDDRRPR